MCQKRTCAIARLIVAHLGRFELSSMWRPSTKHAVKIVLCHHWKTCIMILGACHCYCFFLAKCAMLQHKPIQTIHMLSLSHFRALWCVVAILCSAAMWSVDDICKELADIAQLIAGKKSDDPFCQALIQTSCSKIKGLVVLAPCDALKIKNAAMVLGDDFTNAIWACLEKRLTSVGSELGTPQGPQGMSVCTKPQTLLHPFNYMTAADWKELEHQETSWARKQTIVALRLKLLGIVSMSEKTMKSCLALLACTLTVVPDEKMMYSMLQEFKATFASTSCAVQFSNLTMYPENASDLPQNVFQAAFGSEQPCPKVIDKFNLVARKVILRNTSKHMRGTGGKCADQHQASAGSSLSHGMGMNEWYDEQSNAAHVQHDVQQTHGHEQPWRCAWAFAESARERWPSDLA